MQTPTSVGISATRTPSDGASDNTEESQGPQPWWHERTGDSSREHGLTLVPGLCCGARDAALLRSPPATPRAPSPCPQGGQWALTGELGPAGAGVADAAQGEAPQAVIHQLPVAQPEPQQDPIDLILSWWLQGEGGKESDAAPIQGSLAPSGATRCHLPGQGRGDGTCQRMSTDVVVWGVMERMVGASSGAVGEKRVVRLRRRPGQRRNSPGHVPAAPAPGGADPPAGW